MYLLRQPRILSAAELTRAKGSVADGDKYLRLIEEQAPKLGMLRGALSKAILPYGEETSTLEQFHAENRPELTVLTQKGLSRAEVERMQVPKAPLARLSPRFRSCERVCLCALRCSPSRCDL